MGWAYVGGCNQKVEGVVMKYWYWAATHPVEFFVYSTVAFIVGMYLVYRIGLSIIEDDFREDEEEFTN